MRLCDDDPEAAELPSGSFAESGTNVNVALLVIKAPPNDEEGA